MIQVDLPAAFAVGQIFAFLSQNYLKKTPEKFTNKLLGPFNFYMSCGFVPAGLYLLVGWPSWEAMYTTDWLEKTFNQPWAAGFYVLFVIAIILLGNLGFILAHHWYNKGKDRLVVIGSAAGVMLAVLPFLLRWGVWWKIGTYAQIQANQGYSFWENPFFGGWLFIMCYMTIVTIFTGAWFKKRGKIVGN
ncbi:MAG: hypothetical protein ACM3KR_04155 [Deltaproteobacteria bacterium]